MDIYDNDYKGRMSPTFTFEEVDYEQEEEQEED